MDRQAAMNECDSSSRDQAGPAEHGLRGLVRDLVVLGDLQYQLLTIDARDALRQLVWPAVWSVVAIGLFLGSISIALITVAYLLVDLAGWPRYGGFLAATMLGAGGAAGVFTMLRRRWKASEPSFARSAAELRQNINRIKWLLERGRNGKQVPHA